jgi:hypothetical protein
MMRAALARHLFGILKRAEGHVFRAGLHARLVQDAWPAARPARGSPSTRPRRSAGDRCVPQARIRGPDPRPRSCRGVRPDRRSPPTRARSSGCRNIGRVGLAGAELIEIVVIGDRAGPAAARPGCADFWAGGSLCACGSLPFLRLLVPPLTLPATPVEQRLLPRLSRCSLGQSRHVAATAPTWSIVAPLLQVVWLLGRAGSILSGAAGAMSRCDRTLLGGATNVGEADGVFA